MVDRPPTDKELAEILAQFRRAGRGQLMTDGALEKLAKEIGLNEPDSDTQSDGAPDPAPKTS